MSSQKLRTERVIFVSSHIFLKTNRKNSCLWIWFNNLDLLAEGKDEVLFKGVFPGVPSFSRFRFFLSYKFSS